MKRPLHFVTKLNSRDIQKFNCSLVPSYDRFASACKEVFPTPMATGVHRQSFLNQSLDPPIKISWIRPWTSLPADD